MLPKTHIIFGAIFSLIAYYFLSLDYLQSSLIFVSSFLIDFDHYMWYVNKKKDFSLKNSYYYLKKVRLNKPVMMIFHTIEFLFLVLLLSFLWNGFLFILIGMLFHSVLDIIQMAYEGELEYREFFLTCYLLSEKSNYY
ncbi:Uncharacterised protein [uncultured archaeon]|nr:Uncharacterised protein [uncultured archaeon]